VDREPFLVSVAIPAYNEAVRIATAIASIRAQTEPPAEIIVVDDGSRDGTADVARSLGVRVIEQPNGGVGTARNRAIREASSPWIAFCDADDLWHPEKLQAARLAHEMRPEVDFLFTDYSVENDDVVELPSTFAVSPEFADNVCERIADGICFFDGRVLAGALAQRNFVLPSTVIARRALLAEHAIFFACSLPHDEEFFVAEDLEWYLRLLKQTDALALERSLVRYQRHAGSLSANSGRIRNGDVKLGEMIAKTPERYVDGVAEVFASQRRRHLSESARRSGLAFRFGQMRARMREAQQIEFRVSDELLWLFAYAADLPGGHWLATVAFGAWRTVLRPVVRWRRAR
jgi:glycosyltransferase involved in cell wall biosynthesis